MNPTIIKDPSEWQRTTRESIRNHLRQARGLRRKARIFLKQADRENLRAQKLQSALDHICPQSTPGF